MLAFVAVRWGVVVVGGVRGQIGRHAVRQSCEAHHVSGFAIFTALFVRANLAHVPGGFFMAAAVLALGAADRRADDAVRHAGPLVRLGGLTFGTVLRQTGYSRSPTRRRPP